MKKCLFFFLLLIAGGASGQPDLPSRKPFFRLEKETAHLSAFVKDIAKDSGLFQRQIQKVEVDPSETYSPYHSFPPYLELHYIHLKFYDFDSVKVDEGGTPYAIGKVFMSERYVETDYYDRFRKPGDYKNDNDGFYYYCKVYFDTQNLENRLIIYPNYLANICEKYMHLNDRFCHDGDIQTHDNSIRALIAIPDTDYRDFIAENRFSPRAARGKRAREEIAAFAKTIDKTAVNYNKLFEEKDPENVLGGNVFFKRQIRNNSLRVFVNYAKYMKIFRVIEPKDAPHKSLKLTLLHSKKPNNEDFTDNLSYDFKFIPYNMPPLSDTLSEYVEFTQNPANRRLEYSERPDDEFIAGKKRVFNQLAYETDGLSDIEGCRNSPQGLVPCLEKLRGQLKPDSLRIVAKIDSINAVQKTKAGSMMALQVTLKKYTEDSDLHRTEFNKLPAVAASIEDNFLRNTIRVDSAVAALIDSAYVSQQVSYRQDSVNLSNKLRNITAQAAKVRTTLGEERKDSTQNNTVLDSLEVEKNKLAVKLAKISREIKKANSPNSSFGFIYFDSTMIRSAYRHYQSLDSLYALAYPDQNTDTGPDIDSYRKLYAQEMLRFMYNLCQNAFYVRRDLPGLFSTANTFFLKGEIIEMYEPFNFNKRVVKQHFKFKIPHKSNKNWRELMREEILSKFASGSNLKALKPYWPIYPKQPKWESFWLRIPPEVVAVMPYLNYYFNRHPRRRAGLAWKQRYN